MGTSLQSPTHHKGLTLSFVLAQAMPDWLVPTLCPPKSVLGE